MSMSMTPLSAYVERLHKKRSALIAQSVAKRCETGQSGRTPGQESHSLKKKERGVRAQMGNKSQSYGVSKMIECRGRPQTARRQSWHKIECGADCWQDVTPQPGRTYTRATWPPRGRGRGESLTSPRRMMAKLRTLQVLRLRRAGRTWAAIARALGFKDASGPYRAYKRAVDRADWDARRKEDLLKGRKNTNI